MFCNHCGNELRPGDRYCNLCGTPVPTGFGERAKKYCIHCGSEIPADAAVCPRCGYVANPAAATPPMPGTPAPTPTETPSLNVCALLGFIFSFLSLTFVFIIPSLILCIVGLNQIKAKKQRGKALAIVGLVLTSAFLLILVFGLQSGTV